MRNPFRALGSAMSRTAKTLAPNPAAQSIMVDEHDRRREMVIAVLTQKYTIIMPFGVVMLGLGVYLAFSQGLWLGTTATISGGVIGLFGAFVAAFQIARLRGRVTSLQQFLGTPRHWFPMAIALFILVGVAGVPAPAMAMPTSGDYLAQIFGTTLFPSSSGSIAAIHTAIEIYIAQLAVAVLAIGEMLIMYNLFHSLIITAHTGKVAFFEKSPFTIYRWIAAHMLIITLGSAYPAICFILAKIIGSSIYFANAAWAAVYAATLAGMPVAAPATPSLDEVVYGVAQMAVCANLTNYEARDGESFTPIFEGVSRESLADGGYKWTLSRGGADIAGSAWTYGPDACGSISYTPQPGTPSAVINANIAVVDEAWAMLATPALAAVQAVAGLDSGVYPNLLTPLAGVINPIQAVQASFAQRIGAAISPDYINQITAKIISVATPGDWLMAGMYYHRLASAGSDLSNKITVIPAYTQQKQWPNEWSPTIGDHTTKVRIFLASIWAHRGDPGFSGALQEALNAPMTAYQDHRESALPEQSPSGLASSADALAKRVQEKFTNGISDMANSWAGNPLAVAVRFGSDLTAAAVSAAAACAAVSGVVGLVGGGSLTAILAGPLGWLLHPAFLMVAGAGALLSTFLPLMPIIYWVLGAITWLTEAAAAMLSVPVWVLAHLKPGDGDLHESGGEGYSLLLALFLRPILMIGALVFSLAALGVGVVLIGNLFSVGAAVTNDFVAATVQTTVGGDLASALTRLISIAVETAVLAMLLFYLAKKTCSTMLTFPDSVIQWVSGHLSHVGEEAAQGGNTIIAGSISTGGRQATQAIQAAGGSAPSAGGGSGKGGGGGGGASVKNAASGATKEIEGMSRPAAPAGGGDGQEQGKRPARRATQNKRRAETAVDETSPQVSEVQMRNK